MQKEQDTGSVQDTIVIKLNTKGGMMKIGRIAILAMICLSIVATVSAEVDTRQQVIEQVMELSGAKDLFVKIPAQVQMQYQPKNSQIDQAKYEKISAVIKNAYLPDELYKEAVSIFLINYDEAKFKKILELLNKPLEKKMTELESKAYAPESSKDLESFAKSFDLSDSDPDRISLIMRLDEAGGITKSGVDLQALSFMEATRVLNQSMPVDKKLTPEQLIQLESNYREQIEPQLENLNLIFLSFCYKQATNKELEQYVEDYESELGKWFNKLLADTMMQIMTKPVKDTTPKIVNILQSK